MLLNIYISFDTFEMFSSCRLFSLLHLEPPPGKSTILQFANVTVPGDGIFLSSSQSFAFSNLYPRKRGRILSNKSTSNSLQCQMYSTYLCYFFIYGGNRLIIIGVEFIYPHDSGRIIGVLLG